MTDEPIPGEALGPGHVSAVTMAGGAPAANPFVTPFVTPVRSVPPEIQAIPARTPGFAPRQRTAAAEPAALRPAQVVEVTLQLPVFRDPSVQEAVWGPEPLEYSRRRNNLIIGASTAAAMAVAIGAIALTHDSAPSAEARFSAAFGPGAGDPTGDLHANGQPLDGSTSAPADAGGTAGNQTSDTSEGTVPSPALTTSAAPPAAPPKPDPVTAKPPAAPSKPVVSCTGWHTTHIPAHDGKAYTAAASTLRSGPYANCGGVGTFSAGQRMYIWCHAVNGYGATWVYGRMDNAGAPGWQALTAFKPGAQTGPAC